MKGDSTMDNLLDLYKNIKIKRIELGLSQEELAKKVGYKDRTSIAKIESGKVDLSQSKIIEFAKVLRVSPSYLMGWDNKNDVSNEIINDNLASINPYMLLHYSKHNGTSTSIDEDYYKMDEPQFIVSESKMRKFCSGGASDEQATGQAFDILENFALLNEEGQEKLADYADDLVSSGKYKKHNQAQVGKEA